MASHVVRFALVTFGLLAGCATEQPSSAVPPRWIGVGNITGRIVAGDEAVVGSQLTVTWANIDRRRADRTPETGQASAVDADGTFLIDSLPYGTYELTLNYGASGARVRRVTLDEPEEHLDVEFPSGRIVLQLAEDLQVDSVELRSASLRQGTLLKQWKKPKEHLLMAEGLAAGHYVVRASSRPSLSAKPAPPVSGDDVLMHVELADSADQQVVTLQPTPVGKLQLTLSGWRPDEGQRDHLLLEIYAQTPAQRLFDFTDPVLSRGMPPPHHPITLKLPEGCYALLVTARSSPRGRAGLVAFVPDIVVSSERTLDLSADIPEPRRVLLRAADGKLALQDFGFRLGADLLPARIGTDVNGQWREDGLLLPTHDCAVVAGAARRRGGEEGGTVSPVVPGTGPQEIEVQTD